MIRISVVIPVKNDPIRLQKCVDALLAQSLPHEEFQVIIVDDHSDVPVTIVSPPSASITVHSSMDHGPAAARNEGVKHAVAPYIAFTDADCLPHTNWLQELLSAIVPMGPLAYIGGQMQVSFKNTPPTFIEKYFAIIYFRDEHFLHTYHFFVTANMCTTKETFAKVGNFNHILFLTPAAEDLEFGQRVFKAGIPTQYVKNAIVVHPARTKIGDFLYRSLQNSRGTWRAITLGIVTSSKKKIYDRSVLFYKRQNRICGHTCNLAKSLAKIPSYFICIV